MHYFHHLERHHLLFLLRQGLTHPCYQQELHALFSFSFELGLLHRERWEQELRPYSEASIAIFDHFYAQALTIPRYDLESWCDSILREWIRFIYVDGGLRPRGRAAWAFYDHNQQKVYCDRENGFTDSTSIEWFALVQAAEYASHFQDRLVLIHTDCISIPEQIAMIDEAAPPDIFTFAQQRYQNPYLLELLYYLENWPIDICWASRETDGIRAADWACRSLLS